MAIMKKRLKNSEMFFHRSTLPSFGAAPSYTIAIGAVVFLDRGKSFKTSL